MDFCWTLYGWGGVKNTPSCQIEIAVLVGFREITWHDQINSCDWKCAKNFHDYSIILLTSALFFDDTIGFYLKIDLYSFVCVYLTVYCLRIHLPLLCKLLSRPFKIWKDHGVITIHFLLTKVYFLNDYSNFS